MAKHKMNTVIIPTCGLGSRMGNYTIDFNKALLPYKNKPIISHIIDSFPTDTTFILPVGYMAEQIKDFCDVTYNDRKIIFVDIDDYTGPNSGTLYTLKQCRDLINGPFWYVSCDTYFDQDISDTYDTDCYFVKDVPIDETSLYTMFRVTDNNITDIIFKQKVTDDSYSAFTGLMYIHDYSTWFDTLLHSKNTEFIYEIPLLSKVRYLNSWIDFGSIEIYEQCVANSQKFDFSKKDEITYICNNKVVKYFKDINIPYKKYIRTTYNETVYPSNITYRNNFISYDYKPGTTLYQLNDVTYFSSLLDYLHNNVWKRHTTDITNECVEFYKTKTLSRIQQYIDTHDMPIVTNIDGIDVRDYRYYVENIDYDYLTSNIVPSYIHGDLQFDNIIIDDDKNFTLIDWRQDFAGSIMSGDIYYDLAKLYGGLIVSYSLVKENSFGIAINDTSVTLDIPNIQNIDEYKAILESYITNNNLDLHKVKLLVPLIYLNMSPLHTEPFDRFLWYLGLKMFAELDEIL